jgi:ABC-type nitrate/sulfonate/bicarbonate transport system substrate-binding protein
MRRRTGWLRALAAVGALAGFQVQARAAESAELRISRQPSILYIQTVLMEDGKLIEKHAGPLPINRDHKPISRELRLI